MSKNIAKGKLFESRMSKLVHSRNKACLISSCLLRKYGAGQIDLAYISNKELYLVELKSGQNSYPSHKQLLRLKKSGTFLSEHLNLNIHLKILNSCQIQRPYLSLNR